MKFFRLGIAGFGALLLSIGLSLITKSLGDRLLRFDQYAIANVLYRVSSLTNPWDRDVEQRLLAVRIIHEERTTESEETNDRTIAVGLARMTNVLGTSVTLPVLMYHYIRVNPWPTDTVGFNLSVTPSNFAAQMDYLVEHGFHTISLDELGAALFYKAALPAKPIVITLDDGYADSYTAALPILKQRGMKAVNFVITGVVGGPSVYLTWPEILEMSASGVFTFGAHTVHHSALTYLSDAAVRQELAESKKALEEHLGYPVNWLAYPYGNVNDRVAGLTRAAGFVGAFGTNLGTFQSTDAMFTLPRIRIGGGDSVGSFAAKLP